MGSRELLGKLLERKRRFVSGSELFGRAIHIITLLTEIVLNGAAPHKPRIEVGKLGHRIFNPVKLYVLNVPDPVNQI